VNEAGSAVVARRHADPIKRIRQTLNRVYSQETSLRKQLLLFYPVSRYDASEREPDSYFRLFKPHFWGPTEWDAEYSPDRDHKKNLGSTKALFFLSLLILSSTKLLKKLKGLFFRGGVNELFRREKDCLSSWKSQTFS